MNGTRFRRRRQSRLGAHYSAGVKSFASGGAGADAAETGGIHRLTPGEPVPVERGRPVVCIPVYGRADLFAQCLRSVLSHTPTEVPVLVADDASPDPQILDLVDKLGAVGALRHRLYVLRQPLNLGFVANMNSAFGATAPGDIVVVNSDCIVARGWLEGLSEAAYADTRTATASALTNHGTILSVPDRNRPQATLPQDWTVDTAAAAVRRNSLRLRPEIPTALGHCVYIRREALELAGDFDESFSPGYGEEVDFSQRCVLQGLKHVAADDVFVFHQGRGSFSEAGDKTREKHEAILEMRYPYYREVVQAVENGQDGPLPRALAAARRAFRGLSVTVDARILGPQVTGTQLVVLELLNALSTAGVRLRVLLPPDLGDYASDALADVDVERIDVGEVAWLDRSDVVHRPYQVSSQEELDVLKELGDRIVISHLDLIAYSNPGYFPDFERWEAYRRITRRALALADRIVFISREAADDALRNDLVDAERASVVYPGTDHRLQALRPAPEQPRHLDSSADPFLLILGTDYRHKNRLFALRLVDELRRVHGWPGTLIVAGPHIPQGSSAGDEAAYLAARPDLASIVIEVGAVKEAEKQWLLEQASAVLYPTVYEGFGLVPFEAAAAGTPCLFAPNTSLSEILPPELARLVPWDPVASAERALEVLEGPGREELVGQLRAVAAPYTWRRAADQTLEVYNGAVAAPSRPVGAGRARTRGDQDRAAAYESDYCELIEAMGEEGLSLVGPDGVLPPDMRRPLLAIAVRRWLRWPIFGAIKLPYRLAYRLRHGGRAPSGGRTAISEEPSELRD